MVMRLAPGVVARRCKPFTLRKCYVTCQPIDITTQCNCYTLPPRGGGKKSLGYVGLGTVSGLERV